MEDITHTDYKPTRRVWEDFGIQRSNESFDLYIQCDTLLYQMYSKTSITNAQKNMRLHLFIMSRYTFQSESTLYSCLYVKELLA